jgi:hypothetical protein
MSTDRDDNDVTLEQIRMRESYFGSELILWKVLDMNAPFGFRVQGTYGTQKKQVVKFSDSEKSLTRDRETLVGFAGKSLLNAEVSKMEGKILWLRGSWTHTGLKNRETATTPAQRYANESTGAGNVSGIIDIGGCKCPLCRSSLINSTGDFEVRWDTSRMHARGRWLKGGWEQHGYVRISHPWTWTAWVDDVDSRAPHCRQEPDKKKRDYHTNSDRSKVVQCNEWKRHYGTSCASLFTLMSTATAFGLTVVPAGHSWFNR